ncbi:nucleotide-binding domain-containing protein [Vibrio diabolicus]|uniref:nucleotide-binding domain-containing protein n=1 Tax=Vibrio diabolicus TaxID=50719 RepID=UPI003F8375C4
MSNVNSIYEEANKALARSFKKSTNIGFEDYNLKSLLKGESFSSKEYELSESFTDEETREIQTLNLNIREKIRKQFGKHSQVKNTIGGHPDFNYLKDSNSVKNGFAVTLFIDIQGSTKLGVSYSPDLVFLIKNTIIKCVIETIQAFDGHVHRIMGDAVLAFFRSGKSARESAIDALNCGTLIVEFMRSIVCPYLADQGVEKDVGIRIGIDYGEKESVIWGMYGYPGASEITATSFFVDIAAKLQQKAPRNRILIGKSLKELLDLPNDVWCYKLKKSKDPESIEYYITPNYTDADGKAINYNQYVLNHNEYLSMLPIEDKSSTSKIQIDAVLKKKGKPSNDQYKPCSRIIKPSLGIEFKAKLEVSESIREFKVKFRVRNTGAEAAKEDNNANHETIIESSDSLVKEIYPGYYRCNHWENTSFLGLHFMYVSVLDNKDKVIIPEERFSVYVGDPLIESN